MLETLLQKGDTKERCGLVFDDGTTVELDNVAANPEVSFEMDPVAALEHLNEGNVTGTWHTHPDSVPNLSGEDYRSFMGWPSLDHYIIGIENGATVVAKFQVREGLIHRCN